MNLRAGYFPTLIGSVLVSLTACSGEGPRGATSHQDHTDGASPEPELPSPHECAGERTRCDPVSPTPLEPGPEVACELTDRGPATVLWKTQLDPVSCPYASCPVSFTELAPALDGGMWASADALLPSSMPLVNQSRVGNIALRYDATGALLAGSIASFPSRLAGVPPVTRGMRVDFGNELRWLAASPAANGAEQRTYDAAGKLKASRIVARGSERAQAVFGSDGDVTVANAYPWGEPLYYPSPRSGLGRIDVARLNGDGHLLWNQTAFSSLRSSQDKLALLGSSAASELTLHLVSEPGSRGWMTLIARLDVDGNVSWVRSIAGVASSSTVEAPGGRLVVLHKAVGESGPDTQLTIPMLDSVDANGHGQWRLRLEDLFSPRLLAVDSSGTSWIAELGGILSFSEVGSVTLLAISADGRACNRWTVENETVVDPADGATYSQFPLLGFSDTGALFYATWTSLSQLDVSAP